MPVVFTKHMLPDYLYLIRTVVRPDFGHLGLIACRAGFRIAVILFGADGVARLPRSDGHAHPVALVRIHLL